MSRWLNLAESRGAANPGCSRLSGGSPLSGEQNVAQPLPAAITRS
jgi:hypothetical protein